MQLILLVFNCLYSLFAFVTELQHLSWRNCRNKYQALVYFFPHSAVLFSINLFFFALQLSTLPLPLLCMGVPCIRQEVYPVVQWVVNETLILCLDCERPSDLVALLLVTNLCCIAFCTCPIPLALVRLMCPPIQRISVNDAKFTLEGLCLHACQ